MKRIKKEVNDFINRGMDSNVRIAVTGLSRAGKTAFITSLVNQLLHTATHDNLPLLTAARDKRLIGAKREPQSNMMVPRFAYDEAMSQIHATPPKWPVPTRDVSEIRLALKYKPNKTTKKLLSKTAILNVDIIDYPGEWLLDLPLLDMDFATWSQTQFDALKGQRGDLAKAWLSELEKVDLFAEVNEKLLEKVAHTYTEYLHSCKDAGLHWVQPGRFVLPGELAGAPVLQFFPCRADSESKAPKGSNLAMLEARFQEYQQKVVKAFYKHHFATFDRQIVLVDCLQPLNAGDEAFYDMRQALEQIMHSFRYGRSSFLRRLFSPKIDKVLFAATKADHITPDQHPNLVSLLQQMVHPAWQTAAYENIEMSCMSIASIQATTTGFISSGDKTIPALQGTTLGGEPMTMFPGEVPKKLPNAAYWQNNGFDFTSFRPMPSPNDEPVKHIRLDKALDYLIGDKLK
ncbi:TPA: YcjX family protein [Vibrio alginolyticus]|uniref:YcjX family protein n=1 Tax=Vibrio TaxID=662 RepID=UPI001BD66CFE|nr:MULTISPECIES: YcjX family protein [Vibrio]EGQ8449298.1 YcjX family protein [Vibrio alginolyticus]EGQ9714628.1 YcjX family protein [Vibrio alginolyticus]EGR0196185.1 YcjX family protein [Vibrio alginolyticus]EGR2552863.1 YcjX family protein [Vibrio alginolyticus]EJV5950801.1 YcjX family protein [Vibrio alginolyticus]